MPTHSLPPALDRRVSPRQRALLLRLWPWLAPGFFVGGFAFDLVTMRRVDSLADNAILTLYLLAAAALLVLERRAWHGRATLPWVRDHRNLARLALQFFFGGLFNAYVIFYSKSASFGPSALYCAVLAGLMLANEKWFEDLEPDGPQLGLLFFSAFSYLLFAIPLWTGVLSTGTRLAAAALALGGSTVVLVLIHLGEVGDLVPPRKGPPSRLRPSLVANLSAWSVMVGVLFVGMRLGLVPPVPLALAEAGIFHSVHREGDHVLLSYEAPPWWAPWRDDDRHFAWREGDAVSCFTAIFAPDGAQLGVVDAWEHQEEDGSWHQTDRIPWTMAGGRDDGWRSWTTKQHVQPGRWRVRVLTREGIEVGRVAFTIVATTEPAGELRTRRY